MDISGTGTIQPMVTAVCLVDGRPEMTARAVRCFQTQDYENKWMLVYDTGLQSVERKWEYTKNLAYVADPHAHGSSIGRLRNNANTMLPATRIIIHWDSDDWSDPFRMSEQVSLLQKSRAECTGYNQMLFWDVDNQEAWWYANPNPRYALGTSLCYWRATWEARRFDEVEKQGEDTKFCTRVNSMASTSSLIQEPRMIASIHGGNTCAWIDKTTAEWTRAPHWDDHAREVMCL